MFDKIAQDLSAPNPSNLEMSNEITGVEEGIIKIVKVTGSWDGNELQQPLMDHLNCPQPPVKIEVDDNWNCDIIQPQFVEHANSPQAPVKTEIGQDLSAPNPSSSEMSTEMTGLPEMTIKIVKVEGNWDINKLGLELMEHKNNPLAPVEVEDEHNQDRIKIEPQLLENFECTQPPTNIEVGQELLPASRSDNLEIIDEDVSIIGGTVIRIIKVEDNWDHDELQPVLMEYVNRYKIEDEHNQDSYELEPELTGLTNCPLAPIKIEDEHNQDRIKIEPQLLENFECTQPPTNIEDEHNQDSYELGPELIGLTNCPQVPIKIEDEHNQDRIKIEPQLLENFECTQPPTNIEDEHNQGRIKIEPQLLENFECTQPPTNIEVGQELLPASRSDNLEIIDEDVSIIGGTVIRIIKVEDNWDHDELQPVLMEYVNRYKIEDEHNQDSYELEPELTGLTNCPLAPIKIEDEHNQDRIKIEPQLLENFECTQPPTNIEDEHNQDSYELGPELIGLTNCPQVPIKIEDEHNQDRIKIEPQLLENFECTQPPTNIEDEHNQGRIKIEPQLLENFECTQPPTNIEVGQELLPASRSDNLEIIDEDVSIIGGTVIRIIKVEDNWDHDELQPVLMEYVNRYKIEDEHNQDRIEPQLLENLECTQPPTNIEGHNINEEIEEDQDVMNVLESSILKLNDTQLDILYCRINGIKQSSADINRQKKITLCENILRIKSNHNSLINEIERDNLIQFNKLAIWGRNLNRNVEYLTNHDIPLASTFENAKEFVIKAMSYEMRYQQHLADNNIKNVYSEKYKYSCLACNRRDGNLTWLVAHLCRANSEMIYFCCYCGVLYFNNVCSLIYHIVLDKLYGPKEKICIECNGLFPSLSNHLMDTEGSWKVHCSDCNFVSLSKCSYFIHQRYHNMKRHYLCPECGAFFLFYDLLKKHTSNDCFFKGKKVRYICSFCAVILKDKNLLLEHLHDLHHKRSLKCVKCNSLFTSKLQFVEHRLKEHPEAPSIYQICHTCEMCPGRQFKTSVVKIHMKNHSDDPLNIIITYSCKCEYYTIHKDKFLEHKKSICEPTPNYRKFDDAHEMKICGSCHDIKFVNISKPFICENCEILQNPTLKKAYECKPCKWFLSYSWDAVIQHFFRYHPNIPAPKYCNFVQSTNIASHHSSITLPNVVNKQLQASCSTHPINIHEDTSPLATLHKFYNLSNSALNAPTKPKIHHMNKVQLKIPSKRNSEYLDLSHIAEQNQPGVQNTVMNNEPLIISFENPKSIKRCKHDSILGVNTITGRSNLLLDNNDIPGTSSSSVNRTGKLSKFQILPNEINKTHHKKNTLKFTCNICSRVFLNNQGKKMHMRIHGMAYLKSLRSNSKKI